MLVHRAHCPAEQLNEENCLAEPGLRARRGNTVFKSVEIGGMMF
jgi:hypothetical protein